MEFLKASYFNTSTQIAVSSNTLASANLFNRDPVFQYYSSGDNSDLTTTSITITFDSTTPVSRLALVGMNFKEFKVFYNGATASTFTLVGADTTTSDYATNTDANKYFKFSTIGVSSITIDCKKTITADQEKYIGLFVPSDLIFTLSPIPSARGYKPKLTPKQIVHKLSDGGTRLHNVKKKWDVSIDVDYLSTTNRDLLYSSVFNRNAAFNFCPFGTATGWGGQIFESVWDGPFSFYEFSDNNANVGFSGKITLKETPF